MHIKTLIHHFIGNSSDCMRLVDNLSCFGKEAKTNLVLASILMGQSGFPVSLTDQSSFLCGLTCSCLIRASNLLQTSSITLLSNIKSSVCCSLDGVKYLTVSCRPRCFTTADTRHSSITSYCMASLNKMFNPYSLSPSQMTSVYQHKLLN